jgi:hypothetical protein
MEEYKMDAKDVLSNLDNDHRVSDAVIRRILVLCRVTMYWATHLAGSVVPPVKYAAQCRVVVLSGCIIHTIFEEQFGKVRAVRQEVGRAGKTFLVEPDQLQSIEVVGEEAAEVTYTFFRRHSAGVPAIIMPQRDQSNGHVALEDTADGEVYDLVLEPSVRSLDPQ